MNLYLVQHGEAVTKDIDPERPLSDQGRQDVTNVARLAAKICYMEVPRIRHSGKLRAQQTADILATSLDLPQPLAVDGLAPLDDPAIWAGRCGELSGSIMLVGHLPHLARLAGALLCGGPEAAPVNFQMGGIVALAQEEGRWSLQWMIVPDMLRE